MSHETPKTAICIDNSRLKGRLTKSKRYSVINFFERIYIGGKKGFGAAILVCCDDHVERAYDLDRFEIEI